jgi:hypothetical protein
VKELKEAFLREFIFTKTCALGKRVNLIARCVYIWIVDTYRYRNK